MKKKEKSFRNFHKNFIKKVLPILYFIWKMNEQTAAKKKQKRKEAHTKFLVHCCVDTHSYSHNKIHWETHS
jgi:hypothetical protein